MVWWVQSRHTWVVMWSSVLFKALMDGPIWEDAHTVKDSDLILICWEFLIIQHVQLTGLPRRWRNTAHLLCKTYWSEREVLFLDVWGKEFMTSYAIFLRTEVTHGMVNLPRLLQKELCFTRDTSFCTKSSAIGQCKTRYVVALRYFLSVKQSAAPPQHQSSCCGLTLSVFHKTRGAFSRICPAR